MKKRYQVDLPAQQAEYEINYRRFLKVFPSVASLPEGEEQYYLLGNTSQSESGIVFCITEQTKYTSLVHIVQSDGLPEFHSSDKNGESFVPAMARDEVESNVNVDEQNISKQRYEAEVRLYHDASLAEIISCQHYRGFVPRYAYPNNTMHQINEKNQVNRFLGELLAHCLAHARVAKQITCSPNTESYYVR